MNKHRPAALVFAALFALHLLIFAGALWARRPPVWLVLAALAFLGSMIGWVLLWAIPARATGQPSARFWA